MQSRGVFARTLRVGVTWVAVVALAIDPDLKLEQGQSSDPNDTAPARCSRSEPCSMYSLMYTLRVARRYSIAEARRQLPLVIDTARAGTDVELTRRGQPVAVVVSSEEYARLRGRSKGFAAEYAKFRARFPATGGGIPRRFFDSLRDRSPGRKVRL